MSKTRKDSRGYLLWRGECQRSDGRYSYSYTNRKGERHCIYAKSLVDLRKREQQIRRDIEDGIDPWEAERMTVNQIYDTYISQKYNLKETTKTAYNYTYNHYVRESFGTRKLVKVRYTDVKRFYYSLISEKGLSPAVVDNVHTLLHPSFQMAVRDGYIRVNPTEGALGEMKKSYMWVVKKRRALTIPEQKAFMNYLFSNHAYQGWKPVITVLIGTGMRIGECLGLRWSDLDFKKRFISVNHNLVYMRLDDEDGNLHINTPKTSAGERSIPMIEQVYDAFREEYEIQQITGFCTQEIDGYSGFIFTNSSGSITLPSAVNCAIRKIVADYNAEEKEKAQAEKREPFFLPDISAHHLRHTFCTRLCENETNIKVIQSIMGHKDIQTTLDIYADCTEEKKKEVVSNMENKIFVM